MVKKGKNNQIGKERMSVITSKKNAVVNPVEVICQSMDRLKKVRGNLKGFIFPALRSTSKGVSTLDKPASYKAVLAQFKDILMEAGVASNPSAFGLHSMR